MRLLLDTQILIWAYSQSRQLAPATAELLADPAHELFVSVVTMWEMTIKEQIGKLHLPLPARQFVTNAQREGMMQVLPVTESHVWQVGNLPLHHRDPFDRLLIAQAIVEDLVLLTSDSVFQNYPAKLHQ
jgi:PIN domain nuclease of toxin-antitoxin system